VTSDCFLGQNRCLHLAGVEHLRGVIATCLSVDLSLVICHVLLIKTNRRDAVFRLFAFRLASLLAFQLAGLIAFSR